MIQTLVGIKDREEIFQCFLKFCFRIVVDLFAGSDVFQDRRVFRFKERVKFRFKTNDIFNSDTVQVPFGTGKDDRDLFFNRRWGIWRLLKYLNHSRTSFKLVTAYFVQVGSKLGKRLKFTVLSQVKFQCTGNLFHRFDLSGTTDTGYGDTDVDRRSYTGVKEVCLKEDLTVSNGDDVCRNIRRNVTRLRFDDRKGSQRTGTFLIGKFRCTLKQSAVQVENIPWICFTARRTSKKKGHFTVSNRMLGKIIINDQTVTCAVSEIFTHCYTCVRRKILKCCRLGSTCCDYDRVVHCSVLFESFHYLSDRGAFLTDCNINTDNILPFLGDDCIDCYRCFTGLSVTDDKLTLTTADRYQGIDRFDTCLKRFMYGFTSHDTGSTLLDVSIA